MDRDHPRVCGEHQNNILQTHGCLGSSPRMRGARRVPARREGVGGIIPAYAGSTSLRFPPCVYSRDHPRVCGEHSARLIARHVYRGSSPRMRGAPSLLYNPRGTDGIIPAYAGSTLGSTRSAAPRRDHPRVCGEHTAFAATVSSRRGSSPRMRGALVEYVARAECDGIIPAYAGSTGPSTCSRPARTDHPRVCGEHRVYESGGTYRLGSSPRMRGARDGPRLRGLPRRIIPAYAGSTITAAHNWAAFWDHPRVCGEHTEQGHEAGLV